MGKGDDSPVTRADKAANKIIVEFLEENYPAIPVVSEETKLETAWQKRFFWLVDPIDGTKEFIKYSKKEGGGEFTVNIGLVRAGKPVLGVVYVPVQDTLYYGIPG